MTRYSIRNQNFEPADAFRLTYQDELSHRYAVVLQHPFQAGLTLVEILFDHAVQRAKQLDDYFATHGKTLGPLHGIPMTLKDQFNVKGYDTTLGYVGRAFKPASDDADLVKILEDAGVLFLAKTNLPQSIMASRGLS
jgi:Asp-tRNA(Asn)/Glu-tRNA(Gln) amidotransferase A subunit family amidase